MYSLYRAWFGGEEAYPRLETLSPPDTLVRVGNEGEHQFVAHRGVLAAHSGYLKALLATATTSTSATGREDSATTPVTSVSVSSVGGEAFAPLLNYMYTGRLEVTLDNIYSVLLATHLLHMPGALEQCRAALLRLRGPPPPLPAPPTSRPGTVLRPVPNRLVGPPLCWSQPSLYPAAPVGLPHLPNLPLPPSLSMLPGSMLQEQPAASTLPYSFRENSPSPPPPSLELRRQQHQEARSSPEISIAACRPKEEREKTQDHPDQQQEEEDKRETDRISIVDSVPSPLENNERISFAANEQSVHRRSAGSSRSSNDAAPAGTSGSGVVYDVACCDGPVRFHRVLNENYVSTTTTTTPATTTAAAPQPRPRNLPPEEDLDVGGSGENDENGKPEGNTSTETRNGGGGAGATGSYTCSYCRHTFKSHYCYRKHARRHLLPTVEADRATNSGSAAARPDGRRREVRLLDLNVQYYPCKICGSKFPSYYFVHKHRKLCHANVEERTGSGDGETAASGVHGTGNSEDQ